MQTFGVVPGTDHQCGRGVGSDSEALEELRTVPLQECFDPCVEFGQLVVEACIRPASEHSEALVAFNTGSPLRAGRSRAASVVSRVRSDSAGGSAAGRGQ